jgi:hypothetical protein
MTVGFASYSRNGSQGEDWSDSLGAELGYDWSVGRPQVVAKAREIEVHAGTELAKLIDESQETSLILVKDGVRYRLERVSPEDAEDSDDRSDEATDDEAIMSRFVGAWADVDADALIDELRRAREEGSRPNDQAPVLR